MKPLAFSRVFLIVIDFVGFGEAPEAATLIARPLIGMPGIWERTANRHDFALKPFDRTVLNELILPPEGFVIKTVKDRYARVNKREANRIDEYKATLGGIDL
ncbi:hypothetical protein L1N85_20600 [Paenibacillus alkaliterrae]|uniref:hypothetical protein n=1 Tax=Paenibacillus alkaliterrae TaxID=320909 RepID=UPI001F47063B|nr:hypothetical protein [Paenibacillus alkaliterrae]MCF2940795.1 hypothetical protein [Paenibacillus alkaliterrae]